MLTAGTGSSKGIDAQVARVDFNLIGVVGFGQEGDGARGPSGVPSVSPTVDWVRMAQRFPVRITLADIDPKHPLRKGMRATVRIDTEAEMGGR